MRRAALIGLLGLTVAGCGGSHRPWAGDGALRWSAKPYVYAPPGEPHDRAVLGQITNTTDRGLRLDARKVVVRDAAGHVLRSSARFSSSWGHPLYGAFQQPGYTDQAEEFRLGITGYVAAGGREPLFVSYRLLPGSEPPVTASVGSVRLPLPTEAR